MKLKILIIGITLIMLFSTLTATCKLNNNYTENTQKENYYTYAELTDLLDELQKNYPEIFNYFSIGKTWQGRDIWLVKISDNAEINDSEEPDVLYSGGMHGNEKPGYQTVIKSMISILENYTQSNVNESFTARIRNIVNNSELFFIPIINPDGCEANKRKNGRINKCILGKTIFSGIDLCYNFDYLWDDADKHPLRYILIPRTLEDIKFLIEKKTYHIFERSVVRYPLTDLGSLFKSGFYRGPYPFSEPESRAIKELIENHSILTWLDYHIFGEEIRYPQSCKIDDNPTYFSIMENISKINGYEIFEHPKCRNTSGGATQWAYATHNIISVYIELCSSMETSASYDKEVMLNIFEKHLIVNLYVAERAISMH